MSDNEVVKRQSCGETGPVARPAPEAEPSALVALLARVEAAEGPDRALSGLICCAIDPELNGEWEPSAQFPVSAIQRLGKPGWTRGFAEVTSSLDAALALCERVLPGWTWDLGCDADGFGRFYSAIVWSPDIKRDSGECNSRHSPALALIAALLKAKIAEAASPAERPALPRETGQ